MTRIAYDIFARAYRFTTMPIVRTVKRRCGASPNEMERGDVPGWVMITLMTAVIVVLIWGIASTQLTDLLNSAFGKVSKQGG
jgi:Mg2+/citrate symporter